MSELMVLERDGVLERLRRGNVYGNVFEACKDVIPVEG